MLFRVHRGLRGVHDNVCGRCPQFFKTEIRPTFRSPRARYTVRQNDDFRRSKTTIILSSRLAVVLTRYGCCGRAGTLRRVLRIRWILSRRDEQTVRGVFVRRHVLLRGKRFSNSCPKGNYCYCLNIQTEFLHTYTLHYYTG